MAGLPVTIPYRARGFPSGAPPGVGTLILTSDDLAHALFTTGRAPGDRATHGLASIWEFIHRVSLLPAYIRRTPAGRLTRSRLALALDRSEKVAVSYSIGQALTGVFCDQFLSVRYLMHVDRYARRFGVTFGSTRRRADLFGMQHGGGWVVAEAKGRSNSMEAALEQILVGQKRTIASVSGVPPTIAVGCVASFPARDRMLRVDAFDPENEEIDAVNLAIDVDRFVLAYYEPFLRAIESGESSRGAHGEGEVGVITARFDVVGVTVGLRQDIADLIRRAEEGRIEGLASSVMSALDTDLPAATFADGTVMDTGWESALAIDDWEEYH